MSRCETWLGGWKVLAAALVAAAVQDVTLHAQIIVYGPPPWSSTSIQTTGGITYFVQTATLPDCNWLESSDVILNGKDLSLTVAQMQEMFCPECIDCFHTETDAAVLGSLEPGDYRLWIYTPDPVRPRMLVRLSDFNVPSNSGPTLIASRDPAGVRIAVRGVAGANYAVESSSMLNDWTAVTNVLGAPFDFTVDPAGASSRFYRVAVTPGRLTVD